MQNNRLLQQFLYWGSWLIIPLLWEVLGGIASYFIILVKRISKKSRELVHHPYVSILIPVYNSEDTLEACLRSVIQQNYPAECMEIILIDNGSTDKSYEIFTGLQFEHPSYRIWWSSSEQGKSKALNKGIFGCSGKYIINIDSDGCLDSQAIRNIVSRFEYDKQVNCMTGVVLIRPDRIVQTKRKMLKVLQICELFEYTEGFLVGRNYESTFNSLYTIAGAFSAFRREALLKTQMYNAETLGEDTHMTFQIKNFVGGKTLLCEDAFFYVDPVPSLDKLYIQRQRWQRAQMEVASLFLEDHLGGLLNFLFKPAMRKLLSDHTMAFPRLIWFFAMIYLYFINYPLSLLIGANILLYLSYVLNSFLYLHLSILYLKKQKPVKSYLIKHWYFCFILPVYRFITYWIRVAGIINSIRSKSHWRTQALSEELSAIRSGIKTNVNKRMPVLERIRNIFNHER